MSLLRSWRGRQRLRFAVGVEALEINHQRGFKPALRRNGGLGAGEEIEPLDLLDDRQINARRAAVLQFRGQRREIRVAEALIAIADVALLVCTELRCEATDQVGDFVGDLGVLGRVRVADEWIDGQIFLNQPHIARAGLLEKPGKGLALLRVVGIVLQLAIHVEEHEPDAVAGELREQIERELAFAAAAFGSYAGFTA